jgi:hypothetical protein
MSLTEKLAGIVGKANVITSAKTLERYVRDNSLVEPGACTCVVRPRTPEEVAAVVQLANSMGFAVVPQTSGIHFHGGAVPKTGGVILDCSRMNRITDIVPESNTANIQVGVTWGQLQTALEAKGFMSVIPLLPPASRSAIMDSLEYEPPVIHSHEFAGPLRSLQMVWGNGELFVSGSAGVDNFRAPGVLSDGVLASGPGPMSWDTFLYGAQGTIGIVTWAVTYIEDLPVMSKAFFIPAPSVEKAVEPMYKIMRRGIGYECFLVNNITLATILAEKWPDDFIKLKASLPVWAVILVCRALRRRPEEKLAYEEEALRDIMAQYFTNLDSLTVLPGAGGLERKLPGMLLKPWPEDRTYWKHALKGGCQELMFMTTMEKAGTFMAPVTEIANRFGYAASDIGVYIQPVEDGRACQVDFMFYYDPADEKEKARIREMYLEAAASALKQGAYFNRPYPLIASMVYARYGNYAELLKRFKKHYDPNGILNPGNLCF